MLSDYTTSENIQLTKGQQVQIIQKLNNESCLVQLVNSNDVGTTHQQQQSSTIEVPLNILKISNGKFSKASYADCNNEF